jgi:hypothetical protein
MKPGDVVRMNAACKRALFETDSHDHVREFGRCYGVILGLTDYGNQQGPEWDVRWEPSELKYAYAEEHLVEMPLKAFVVAYDDETREQYGCIVFAYTTQHARDIGACDMSADYEGVYAYRALEHEARASKYPEPGVEEDREYLRSVGWHHEGEWECTCCGLAANGLEQYGVCRMCHQCKECGCEEDCDQSDGFSCE